jgi:GntR family transcriptional repressor for pyruvate dehydrogenase complex
MTGGKTNGMEYLEEGRKMTEQVLDEIQSQILSGKLRAGDRLPSERKMAQTLGVSRHTLREALSALASMGIIESLQGSGHCITQDPLSSSHQPLSMLYKLGGGSFEDIIICRIILEIWAIKAICKKNDPSSLVKLHQIIEKTKQAKTMAELIELDLQFHAETIYQGENLLVSYFIHSVYDLIRGQISYVHEHQKTHIPEANTADNHTEIYEALVRSDARAAYNALLDGYKLMWPNIDFSKIDFLF